MKTKTSLKKRNKGFTFVELIIVISLLSILAAFAISRYADLSRTAKVATLEGIAGSMRSAISIAKNSAKIKGLPLLTSPAAQTTFFVDTEIGELEVDYRNHCPESRSDFTGRVDMVDFIDLAEAKDMSTLVRNRYTVVGFDIRGNGPVTAEGCYVTYDSFATPDCTVTLVTADC